MNEFASALPNQKKIHILEFAYSRTNPGNSRGKAEFFVSGEYVKEKIELLRKNCKIREFDWDSSKRDWKEVQRKKFYRKATVL